jgi:hypothetical protein
VAIIIKSPSGTLPQAQHQQHHHLIQERFSPILAGQQIWQDSRTFYLLKRQIRNLRFDPGVAQILSIHNLGKPE